MNETIQENTPIWLTVVAIVGAAIWQWLKRPTDKTK
jgi:hypothetical protein